MTEPGLEPGESGSKVCAPDHRAHGLENEEDPALAQRPGQQEGGKGRAQSGRGVVSAGAEVLAGTTGTRGGCSPEQWVPKGCPDGPKHEWEGRGGKKGLKTHVRQRPARAKIQQDPRGDGSQGEQGASRGEAEEGWEGPQSP